MTLKSVLGNLLGILFILLQINGKIFNIVFDRYGWRLLSMIPLLSLKTNISLTVTGGVYSDFFPFSLWMR